MGNEVTSMHLLLDYAGDKVLMLHRQGPNPADAGASINQNTNQTALNNG